MKEWTENTTEDGQAGKRLKITVGARRNMKEAATWARFIAILGFVAAALSALCGSAFLSFGALMPGMRVMQPGAIGMILAEAWFFAIAGIVIPAVVIVPLIRLHRFAGKVYRAFETNDTAEIGSALDDLGTFYKYMGIALIVFLLAVAVTAVWLYRYLAPISTTSTL